MDQCNPDYENAVWAYYRFVPSKAANIAFVVLFAVATLLHSLQLWRTRTWYLIPLALGGLCGGLMAVADLSKTGERIVVGGLFVQLFFFGCFIAVSAVFHCRTRRAPTLQSTDPKVRWQTYLMTLYVTGALIWVRSLFRVVEFIEGNRGELMRSEVWVFVFDGMLMLMVLVWMNWFHPGEIGLLLRGEEPIRNGLELVGKMNKKKKKGSTMESLSLGQNV
ncbi:hypothetical protein F66182_2121 [Fusarium sp. NRRL 66182]|nr:hypothetical protein F66182_2121 [Fusarium sp. NRRL 66182]